MDEVHALLVFCLLKHSEIGVPDQLLLSMTSQGLQLGLCSYAYMSISIVKMCKCLKACTALCVYFCVCTCYQ